VKEEYREAAVHKSETVIDGAGVCVCVCVSFSTVSHAERFKGVHLLLSLTQSVIEFSS